MKEHKKKPQRKLILALIILIALAVGGYFVVESGIKPNILAISEAMLKNRAINIMNEASTYGITQMGNPQDLIEIQKDNNGKVAVVSSNTLMLNMLANHITTKAQSELAKLGEEYIKIPLGNIISSKLFAGLGPSINVKVDPMGKIDTEFFSEFNQAGINQTRYRVYIKIQAFMRIVAGGIYQTVELSSTVMVSEAIIVGEVPSTYADVASLDDFMNLMP